MTKIDIFSGFLGAGKTTLIKKLLKEALKDSKVVLIENEFGEIGIDGGFLQESGIEIKEMNSGCICCSLVGDFGASLKEVITTYAPERVLIEPSGVGKLSDVVKAVDDVAANLDVQVNSAVAVVDAAKCKMYIKNFGEFFCNQIACAGTIVLSRTQNVSQEKINTAVELIREHNKEATIITTPWDDLDGVDILKTIEGADKLEDMIAQLLHEEHDHHHEHDEHCTCGCHDHDHEGHEHHHHHDHEGHEHHHHHDHEGHEHHHHHEHHHDHEHEGHEHSEHCTCGCHDHDHEGHEHHHHHHHHHADEVFTSWGKETANVYTREKIEEILHTLEDESYGMILRAKGMVPAEDGTWIYFDYVPGESDIRTGNAMVTGKLCVIGSKISEEKLEALFGV